MGSFADTKYAPDLIGRVRATGSGKREASGPTFPTLVAAWEFESSGADALGNHDGTPVGSPTFVPAKVGNGCRAEKTGKYHQIAHHANLTPGATPYSLVGWSEFKSVPTGTPHGIFVKGDPFVQRGMSLATTGSALTIRFRALDTFVQIAGQAKDVPFFWHCYVLHNGGNSWTWGLQVNGGVRSQQTKTFAANWGTDDFLIGKAINNSDWNGDQIDDQVMLFREPLSDDHVATLYNGGAGLTVAQVLAL